MKLKYIAAFIVAFIAFDTKANANFIFDPYVGATVGFGGQTIFANDNDTSNTAQSYGAVIGLDIPILRIEAEYDYINTEITSLNLGIINLYAKIPSLIIQPYIGVGIGGTFDSKYDEAKVDNGEAFQSMLGLTFDIPVLPIKIDAEARALYIPNFYDINDVKTDLLNYDLRLKLRYIF